MADQVVHEPFAAETIGHLLLAAFAQLAVAGTSLVLQSATYDPAVQGPWPLVVAALLLGTVAAALLSTLLFARGAGVWVAGFAWIALAAVSPAVHGIRMANRAALQVVALDVARGYGLTVAPTLGDGATLLPEGTGLRLHVPPGVTGYVDVRLDAGRQANWFWWLPRGLAGAESNSLIEEVAWTATISRERGYFGLAQTDRLQVELTSWGVTITHKDAGGVSTNTGVDLPIPASAAQSWTLRRRNGGLVLFNGDSQIWSAPDSGAFEFVRLGEVRSDGEHGGTLLVSALRYSRRLP